MTHSACIHNILLNYNEKFYRISSNSLRGDDMIGKVYIKFEQQQCTDHTSFVTEHQVNN